MRTVRRPSDRAHLLGRLAALDAGTQPLWGRMSAHGMVCHLTDSFEVVLGSRPTSRTGTLLERTAIRLLALTLPVPWPRGVPTVPEVDQEGGGTRPGDFEADRGRLHTAMAEFMSQLPSRPMTHPILGRLTPAEWGRWGYRHMDHHLRQFGL